MVVFWGEGKPEYPEKTSRCREENQQTQPTYDARSVNRTRATLVECSHRCPIPAPLGLKWCHFECLAIQANERSVINFTWIIFWGLFLYGLLLWKRMLNYQLPQKHKLDWPFSTYREGFNLTNLYLVPFASRLSLIFPTFACFRNIG